MTNAIFINHHSSIFCIYLCGMGINLNFTLYQAFEVG
jgi:hypothetical protein